MENFEVRVKVPDRMIVEAESADEATGKVLKAFGDGAELVEVIPVPTDFGPVDENADEAEADGGEDAG